MQVLVLTWCLLIPGHGRSEGLHLYIHSWDEFVDEAADFVQQFVLPKQTQWSNVAKRPNGLRLFAHGESMGGGVAVSIAIKHPELFDGMVLIAPMIHISAKVASELSMSVECARGAEMSCRGVPGNAAKGHRVAVHQDCKVLSACSHSPHQGHQRARVV